jgi:long-chain acyl-CoA synthetase
MLEYHGDPAKTSEALDADGWLHTGDIGELLLPNGELAVIDRIKHLFKLAQGEYVSPETLEQLYLQSSTTAQIFVNGDSLQASLVAIVHPNQGFAEKKIRELGLPAETTLEEFCQLAEAKQAVLEDLERIGKASKVNGYELIKAVHLISQPFEALGLLTPTFKLKRNESRQHFAEICAQLYASVPQ